MEPVAERPWEGRTELDAIEHVLGPQGGVGRLLGSETVGVWLDVAGEYALYAAMAWFVINLVAMLLAGPKHGERAVIALNKPIVLAVGFAVGWLAWLPVRLLGRAFGRAVPALTLAAIMRLFGPGVRHVRTPEDEILARLEVDPRKALTVEVPHGYIWTPIGLVEAVSMALVAESNAAKGQTMVNYAVEAHMRHSDEHALLLEIKPNLELSNIVYAHLRPGDRLYEYTFQVKDLESSALRLFDDPDALADIAHALCAEAAAGDGAHWNDKAAELIEAVSQALGHKHALPGGMAQLPQVADVIADRAKLDALAREYAIVSNVADTPSEFGSIRSSARKRLKPLASPVFRRVFAAGNPDIEQPDPSRRDGRNIIIVRPDWSSLRRTLRFLTALIHALVMAAVRGGYAGGPGTKLYLDEMGSAMRPTFLGEYLDLARGGRLNITYVLQNRAQLADHLDRDEAERVWRSTEAKIVGPTSDLATADELARLSGRTRVHYAGPRQHDEMLASTREEVRPVVAAEEVTSQQEGEFTFVHRGRVVKYAVRKKRYHHTQAAPPPPERPRPIGVADPKDYEAPPLFGSGEPDDEADPADELEDY